MRKSVLSLLVGIAVLGLSSRVSAGISVFLEPATQTINVGGLTTLDLIISGLGNNAVGGFDFDLNYDPAILSGLSVSFGNKLDLGTAGGSAQFSDLSTPGSIHLDEVSFQTTADLLAAQTGSFTLATFSFQGLAPGTALLDFVSGSLSDASGLTVLPFDALGGRIRVDQPVSTPEASATASLLAAGLCCLEFFRRRLANHS